MKQSSKALGLVNKILSAKAGIFQLKKFWSFQKLDKLPKYATFLDLAAITWYRGSQKEAEMINTSSMIDNILSIHNTDNDGYVSEAYLVSEYQNTVYRYCLSLTYRREDADDLFQDTYLRAFSVIDKIAAFENPQSFLLSIATSIWKSNKRKFARRRRIAPEADYNESCISEKASPEDDVIAGEEIIIVRDLVNDLPDKLKIPIVMYYTVEMSISNISDTLGLPLGTVKSRLSRGREIIRKGLVNKYGNE